MVQIDRVAGGVCLLAVINAISRLRRSMPRRLRRSAFWRIALTFRSIAVAAISVYSVLTVFGVEFSSAGSASLEELAEGDRWPADACDNAELETFVHETREALVTSGLKAYLFPDAHALSAPDLEAELRGAGAAAVVIRLDGRDVTVAAATALRVVARHGVGVDNIDFAPREAGGVVDNAPGSNSGAVADLTFGAMLALARQLAPAHGVMIAGRWDRFPGVGLAAERSASSALDASGRRSHAAPRGSTWASWPSTRSSQPTCRTPPGSAAPLSTRS
ncbi:hypothetical protein IFT36_06520 [Frigoribacterium sp. CFBP 13605]|nr:hypothetical protein [Frigoribacterium sp. CFBP 13605]MBD8140200.1 hypothetical protein [Frigoribacterium sp. CFBP 13605]